MTNFNGPIGSATVNTVTVSGKPVVRMTIAGQVDADSYHDFIEAAYDHGCANDCDVEIWRYGRRVDVARRCDS